MSQQQKVTKSKYLKDLGHAEVDQSNADDIINATTTQGIYDLTLGLSDKERRVLVAGKAHEASAITYGEAKEGAIKAHNFSSNASLTMIHSSNERKRDAKSVASSKTLAKLVYSIDTSKVTEDRMEDEKEDEEEESEDNKNPSANKKVAIEGMWIVIGKKKNKKAMLSETELMDEEGEGDKDDREDEGERELGNSEETDQSKEEEPSGEEGEREEREEMEDNEDWKKINETMNANMASATAQLNSNLEDEEDEESSKEGGSFKECNESIYTGEDDLSEGKYDSDVEEVSSRIFDAEHSKKYETPQNFMQAPWNASGPAV